MAEFKDRTIASNFQKASNLKLSDIVVQNVAQFLPDGHARNYISSFTGEEKDIMPVIYEAERYLYLYENGYKNFINSDSFYLVPHDEVTAQKAKARIVEIDCSRLSMLELLVVPEFSLPYAKKEEPPFLKALKTGQPVVLKNFSKIEENNFGPRLIQFLIGEIPDVEISCGAFGKVKLDQRDIPSGFRVWITSPEPKDGFDIGGLSNSVKARLSPTLIPAP